MRFINDDVTLMHDRRDVLYSNSGFALLQAMSDMATNLGCVNNDPFDLVDNDIYAHKVIKAIVNGAPSVQCDNVYGVGIENFIRKSYRQSKNDIGRANDMLGLHVFDNGLTFYGFVAGGDAQRSVFVIIYHDGQHLRLYTPRCGNKLNLHRQEPLMDNKHSDKYVSKYTLDKATLGFNWDAMKIDILANFTVDYQSYMASLVNGDKGGA